MFKKWEVVIIEYGIPFNDLTKENYYKNELKNGINVGMEFSYKHYGIVISPKFLNKYKVVVLPITSKRPKYNCSYVNMVCLNKDKYKFLSKDSVILLNDIKSISVERISKFTDKEGNIKEFFIRHKEQVEIMEKFNKLFFDIDLKKWNPEG